MTDKGYEEAAADMALWDMIRRTRDPRDFPARRGRPPAPDSDKRKMRTIRLTDEEWAMVRELGYQRHVEAIRQAYLDL